jgi:hypothetical protein
LGSGEDQAGKRRDGGTSNIEPCAEVVPVADAEFGAGLGEGDEGIARIATAMLRVPPETLRLVTWQRMSFSEPLVCSGISGRSSTLSPPDLEILLPRPAKPLILHHAILTEGGKG